jgi:hypothetical protein
MGESLAESFDIARRYVIARVKGRAYRAAFDQVRTYCTFIGYPRSGHSLIGSLLDAHPEMIIANELDALKYLARGFDREQLYSLLLDESRLFKRRGAWSSGYCYLVPTQRQGEFDELVVIGDKKGAGTIKRLQDDFSLLDRLRATVGVPVKFVHIVRNPYDNITTIYNRKQKLSPPPSLTECVDYYFGLASTVEKVRQHTDAADVVDIRQEDFVADPEGTLAQLCEFLGVPAPADYLHDCAAIVYESPNKSRHKIEWSPAVIEEVAARMRPFSFLDGYAF